MNVDSGNEFEPGLLSEQVPPTEGVPESKVSPAEQQMQKAAQSVVDQLLDYARAHSNLSIIRRQRHVDPRDIQDAASDYRQAGERHQELVNTFLQLHLAEADRLAAIGRAQVLR